MTAESRVLVIYTGGTIGMLVGHHGYVPEPHFLTETLRSQTRFHDPLQDSLFSNAASVQGFRQWSSSGRSTPQPASAPLHTLAVRSSRPINRADCAPVADGIYEAQLPSLVTPPSAVPGSAKKRIRYAVLEWDPLLDSSNIEIDDWIRIATEIELNYGFDAFVVLHGTDTMSYTSSALSFLLEDLGKTVIITGAQIPLSELRNDAVENLMGALSIAGHYTIPECCLYFNHTLYRGNRVSKVSSYDLAAFDSPNFSPLVNVGIDIVVNWSDVIRQTGLRPFRAHKAMSAQVATLRLFPGITAATVRAFLDPAIRGVVLETFGAGNAPQRADLVAPLAAACARGVVVVAISQCAKGAVSDAYETGRTLRDAGVVPGGDMTPECALAKLSYLLSKPALAPAEIRALMGTPLRGELTPPAPAPAAPTADDARTHAILAQLARLAAPLPSPSVALHSTPSLGSFPFAPGSPPAPAAAAPWARTAAEAAAGAAALLPPLVHAAAARDDARALEFALAEGVGADIAGGLANCADASGRAPLHTAALAGAARAAGALLAAGALVHVRDALGHTALYYAARQRHAETVAVLAQAGARLGAFDVEAGYVALAVANARRAGDRAALAVWRAAGARVGEEGDEQAPAGDLIQVGER